MKGISAYRRLRSYWRKKRPRRGYQRLNGPSDHDPVAIDTAQPRRRSWRVRVGKRIRVPSRIGSPKKWLARLRDAYVKMMLNIANSGLVSSGYGGSIEHGLGFGKGPLKEYDDKVIVQIHKSLVMAHAQGGSVLLDVPKHGPHQLPHVVSAG